MMLKPAAARSVMTEVPYSERSPFAPQDGAMRIVGSWEL